MITTWELDHVVEQDVEEAPLLRCLYIAADVRWGNPLNMISP